MKKLLLFIIIAICSYIAAIIFFISSLKYLGGMWIAIGSLNLLVGMKNFNK